MDERAFYQERTETKPASFTCPHCRTPGDYQVRWMVREKRKELPRGADPDARARFAKARSYMVRIDEVFACVRCRKRFESPSQQSVVLL